MNFITKLFYLSLIFLCLNSVAFSQQSMVGEKAYVFTSKTLEGDSRFYLSEVIEKDKLIFVNFFATWCSPCIQELPLLNKFYQQNNSTFEMIIIDVNNLSVLKNNSPISLPEDPSDAKKILADNNITFTSLFDKHAFIARQYNVVNLPHSVLIKNGIIVWEGRSKLTTLVLNNLKKFLNDN